MLDAADAIRSDGNVLVFHCMYHDCINEVRSEKWPRKLLKHSGYCRRHSHSYIDKPFLGTYNHFKDSILRTNKKRNRNIEFALSYEEFLFFTQIGTCHYCGEANIVWNEFIGNGRHKYNLDRKDNTRGYTCDNVVVCCKDCNFMKRDWLSYEEFKAVRRFLKNWRESDVNGREEMTYELVSYNMKIW